MTPDMNRWLHLAGYSRERLGEYKTLEHRAYRRGPGYRFKRVRGWLLNPGTLDVLAYRDRSSTVARYQPIVRIA